MPPETQVALLARSALWGLRARVQNALANSRLLCCIVFSALVIYVIVGHFLFAKGLTRVSGLPAVGNLLAERILFLIFFLFFLMLVFSNTIINYISLFRSKETNWLLTLPISHRALFTWRALEGLVFSSWGLVVLSAPILLAYGGLGDAGIGFYLLSFSSIIAFISIPACLSSWILVAIIRWFPARKGWGLLVAAAVALVCLIVYFVRSNRGMFSDFSNTGSAAVALGDALKHTDISMANWLPSAWMSEAIYGWGQLGQASPWFNALLLLSTALFFLLFTFSVAGRSFYPAWCRSVKRGAARSIARRLNPNTSPSADAESSAPLDTTTPNRFTPYLAITRKDLLSFCREPAQWIQSLIIFGLLSVYVLNLQNMGYNYEDPKWLTIIVYLNFTVCSLALSTLTTRFVFPRFSLEGQRLWLLGMAPVSLSSILLLKFLQSTLATGLATVALMLLSGHVLDLPPAKIGYLAIGMGLLTLCLNAIALGLGTLIPDFKQPNPAKIVSSFGGTICLVSSFLTLVTTVVLLALPDIASLVDTFKAGLAPQWITQKNALIAVAFITVITSTTVMWAACKKINRLNFLGYL